MPRVDRVKALIQRGTPVVRSVRVMQLEGLFDVAPADRNDLEWAVDLPIEDKDWNVGLIVGPSGCGKSTVARELFAKNYVAGYDWPKDRSVLDGFPTGMPIKDSLRPRHRRHRRRSVARERPGRVRHRAEPQAGQRPVRRQRQGDGVIAPSNGRIVLFTPDDHFQGKQHSKDQPLPAMICHVWGPTMVNLSVTDSNGNTWPVTSVELLQDDAAPTMSRYCEWMPFQKGQAAKTEAAEAALAKKETSNG